MQLLEQIYTHCQRAPTHPAVVDAVGSVTYGALWNGAQRISAQLAQHAGVTRQRPVAVCMPKSAQTVAAFLACWIGDVPYIPLAPDAPRERLLQMLRTAQVQCVCIPEVQKEAQQGDSQELAHWLQAQGLTTISVARTIFDEVDPVLQATHQATVPTVRAADSVAAILFTSGSTGTPKAAQITCANLDYFVRWVHQAFTLTAQDRLASHAAFQFDLSFLDLYGCLTAGASVHLVPESLAGSGAALAQWINAQAITLWQSVPSVLGLIAQADTPMPQVRQVLFAGERMPHARLLSLHDCFPAATFYNIYGCTETNNTFMYTVPKCRAEIPDPLPIGSALPGTRYLILDEQMQPAAAGAAGVLWVHTPTLMRGYLDAERTAEVIQHRVSDTGETLPYYLTNDLVRVLPSGDMEYLGRNDWVLKTSGYRVSLQEIEAAIDLHEAIEEVGVIGVPDHDLGHRLIAIVRPQSGITLNSLHMKVHCSTRLPRYMIPHQFLFREQVLPKNRNGKLDRNVLQQQLAGSAD